jgi:hypothetical protein
MLTLHFFLQTATGSASNDLEQNYVKKRAINYTIDNYMDLMRAFDSLTLNITNVYRMEDRKLSSAKLTPDFWSYHSLPLHKGGTANRFNHNEFNLLYSWNQRYSSFLENPTESFIVNRISHKLSPIEKYEIIVGSKDFSLTLKEWELGKDYINNLGAIPSWIGACHGTAPAAISHARPEKAVSVLSFDGETSIIFYPSDIKALLAFAWTTNGGPSAVMGSRCHAFNNFAVKSCVDTNPGSFHLALTNLIGIHNKPLLIDTDSGPQVWNRPVISYNFSYFNPQFRNYTRRISTAIIDLDKYHNDPYKNYRAPRAKKVVGVRAEIELIDDTSPSDNLIDHSSNDRFFKLAYTYDLELDQHGEIIGGMWHQPQYPDFVWVVSEKNLPLSNSERWFPRPTSVSSTVARLPIPLVEIAQDSIKSDQVSYWVIEYLLRLSSKN